LEIFGIEFHKIQYYSYFEENLSTQCTNLGKFGHCNEQKVWKFGYCNEQIYGKIWWILTEIWRIFGGYIERIYGKIWWILPKAGKQNGGTVPENI